MNDIADIAPDIKESQLIANTDSPELSEEELQIFNSILEEGEEGRSKPRPSPAARKEKPVLNKSFWKKTRQLPASSSKIAISIRLDADVLEWFKTQSNRYQSRMNAVLRAYMESQGRR